MKITVEFDSEDEFKARIKNPRGKGEAEDKVSTSAPAPLMPPQTVGAVAFTPPANPAPAPGNPFAPPSGDPAVAGLVQRISARIDSAIASGQSAEQALSWFRGQCGAEAAAATMDQIKTVFLPKLTAVGLEQLRNLWVRN